MARTHRTQHPSDHRSVIAVRRTTSTVLGAVTVLMLATSTAPAPTRAADAPSIAVQHWGGAVTGVAADGDTAYVAIGPRLAVVDVADAAAPRIVGQSEPVDDVVTHPFVRGEHVIALGENHGLVVFDVADRTAPRVVGRVAALGRSTDLDVVGDRAYVCDEKGGVRIIDVTDPAAPTIVAEWAPPVGSATTAAAAGDRVYVGVTSEVPELVVLDTLRVPPVVLARVAMPDTLGPRDIALAPGWAYMAVDSTFVAFDISDPTAPERAADDTDSFDSLQVLAVDGSVVWATSGSYAYVLDVRDPAAIVRRSLFDLDDNFYSGLAIDGERAYIADSAGLHIVDIGEPLLEPVVGIGAPNDGPGSGAPGTGPRALALHDGYVLVASGMSGLRVLDGTVPLTATEVARLPTVPGGAPNIGTTAVVVSGDRAFTAEDALGGGLRVIEIGDPSQPREVGSIAAPGKAGRPAVAGDLVAVPTAGAGIGGVRLYRVAADGTPTSLGSLTLDVGCQVAALDGTRLFLGSDAGLFIVDIADPAAPVLVGSAPELSAWGGIVVMAPDRLLVADFNFGLYEVDISDPSAPAIRARHRLTGGADDIARHGDDLWVANNYAGVTRLALSDGGEQLRPTGRWFVDQAAFAVAPGSEAVWIVGNDGLISIDPASPSMPRTVGTLPSPGLLVRAAIADGRIATVSSWNIDRRVLHVLQDGAPLEPLGATPLGPFFNIDTPGDALALSNEVAWVPAGGYGIVGYDLRNPAAIRRLTGWRDDHSLVIESLVVRDGRAVGLSERNEVVVLDVSDPVRPVVIGRTTVRRGEPSSLAVVGQTAWVLTNNGEDSELYAFDIAQPATITELGRWPLAEAATELSAEGDQLAIAGGAAGLLVWDIARPEAAHQVARLPFVGHVEGVALSDGIAWVVEWPSPSYRVSAVELLSAGGPAVLASTTVPDWVEADIAADGLTAVVANGHAGLYVLHLANRPPVDGPLTAGATPPPSPTAPTGRLFLPVAYIGRPVAHVTLALDRSAAMALAAGDDASGPTGSSASRLAVAQHAARRLTARLGAADVRVSLIAYDAQAERLPSSGAAAVEAALSNLSIDTGNALAATARHDVALAAVATDVAGAPERCTATVVITAGRSAGAAADGMALARANALGARGVARFVVRVGADPAADDAWLAELAGDPARLRSVRSPSDAEAAADRLADVLSACP